jgi:hypothetical protein
MILLISGFGLNQMVVVTPNVEGTAGAAGGPALVRSIEVLPRLRAVQPPYPDSKGTWQWA